ncbi:bile salt-activated lipase-like [Haliotis rubra]|uniref:bile salt-activated lipase-like n=1 Tax=Haliotis rubra TaxID=36100 RepID=UPI001EE60749|nr:bile salt-activated lipase-like [Haliotis rubra]
MRLSAAVQRLQLQIIGSCQRLQHEIIGSCATTAASDYRQLCNDGSFRLPAAVQRLQLQIIGSCATTAASDYRQLCNDCNFRLPAAVQRQHHEIIRHSCDHPISLGLLGFLSTEDDVSAGNYGLWDQHLALQWIKKTIASFGGDIKSITLMGESAGSEDSHAEQGDSASMIACLRTVSAKKLTAASWPMASIAETSNIPVIVWIHGGGFIGGDAFTFDPSSIVAHGQVIVVTIQYRLGPLGFLSTKDKVSAGNYGLWDQHLALQWVKKNIASFGGDINSITLMGESAGSASVAFQALYTGSKDLFQRIIMQSGSASFSWAHTRNPLKYARQLAHKLNCFSQSDPASMLTCLRSIPAKKLVAASWPMGNEPVTALFQFYFIPTIDGVFVKDDPLKLMNSPGYLKQVGLQNLDCMVSVVSNEGGLIQIVTKAADKQFHSSLSSSVENNRFYRNIFIPAILQLYFGTSSSDMTQAVAKVYAPSQSHTVTLQAGMNTLGDVGMVAPATLFARAHSKLTSSSKTGKKTYMYVFDHIPSFIIGHGKGMDHGEDLMYTFGLSKAYLAAMTKAFPNTITDPDQSEKKLAHMMM